MNINKLRVFRILMLSGLLTIVILLTFFCTSSSDYNIIAVDTNETDSIIDNNQSISFQEEYNNKDIVGKITIPGTDINNYFVQGSDNKYYLRRNLNKEKDPRGSIFLDYRNTLDDRKLLIYGHNSKSRKAWFNELEKFADSDFNSKYKKIYLETNEKKDVYEIFSVKIISNTTKNHMKLAFNDLEYKEHINWLKENSLIESSLNVEVNDQILTLQTCFYSPKDSFLIISAKKL